MNTAIKRKVYTIQITEATDDRNYVKCTIYVFNNQKKNVFISETDGEALARFVTGSVTILDTNNQEYFLLEVGFLSISNKVRTVEIYQMDEQMLMNYKMKKLNITFDVEGETVKQVVLHKLFLSLYNIPFKDALEMNSTINPVILANIKDKKVIKAIDILGPQGIQASKNRAALYTNVASIKV